jgi:hypothetical protein
VDYFVNNPAKLWKSLEWLKDIGLVFAVAGGCDFSYNYLEDAVQRCRRTRETRNCNKQGAYGKGARTVPQIQ